MFPAFNIFALRKCHSPSFFKFNLLLLGERIRKRLETGWFTSTIYWFYYIIRTIVKVTLQRYTVFHLSVPWFGLIRLHFRVYSPSVIPLWVLSTFLCFSLFFCIAYHIGIFFRICQCLCDASLGNFLQFFLFFFVFRASCFGDGSLGNVCLLKTLPSISLPIK